MEGLLLAAEVVFELNEGGFCDVPHMAAGSVLFRVFKMFSQSHGASGVDLRTVY